MVLFTVAGYFLGPFAGLTQGVWVGLLLGLIFARFVPNAAACPIKTES